MGYENISFHAHNKHGLALENTLRAIELGAYSVDVTANGLGNNLATEDLFAKLN
jgi:isopropylmalate/homocitrate/citramalate synthase